MTPATLQIAKAENEKILDYEPGSKEKAELKATITDLKSQQLDIPMCINGQDVRGVNEVTMHPPHELAHTLGKYGKGDGTHVSQAIESALAARNEWAKWPAKDRAGIFLKAADLLAGPYRAKLNASTMLCQSKNVFQAEIDAACELIDFFRYNAEYMEEIYGIQPNSIEGVNNSLEYRALEGFVLAVTPFNFTSIAGNLPSAPALLGNTVVWKPSSTQVYSAHFIMELLKEAGLPDGVINLVFASGPDISERALSHPDLAGVHFTGSTGTFQSMWQKIGGNIQNYKSYPRIVGETGGKDFIVAHRSADPKPLITALTRGAFEYQGQKCSATSRAYIPTNLWDEVREGLCADLADLTMGTVEDFTNFINAVIDDRSFDKIAGYIDQAKKDGQEIIAGGNYDKSEGYFIEPTVIVTKDPKYTTMCEEIFGPVLTIYVYDENKYEETLELVDSSSIYGLTGAIFAQEKDAVTLASSRLIHAAGNFYINDKPSGAVVGQQPFGGARASGTNDKAGSLLNLIRWTSPRTIKETLAPPSDYRYPFMKEE